MSKPALRFSAITLSILIVVVLFAGLDDLPRGVRSRIAADQTALAEGKSQLDRQRKELARYILSDPALFTGGALDAALQTRLQAADAKLRSAEQDMAALAELAKKNRRQDRERAEQLLGHEASLRSAAVNEASSVIADANRRIEFKRTLPQRLAEMQRNYEAARGFDLAAVSSAVAKAGTDWPEKKADLENRLSGLRNVADESQKLWASTDDQRRLAATGDLAKVDAGALAAASDALAANAANLPKQASEVQSLTGQLYYTWDKILVDLDRLRGDPPQFREKIRTVRTKLVDVAANKSDSPRSDEQWVNISQADFDRVEKNIGMAIEHKAAGKFDSEADRVPQPAGFAYVAPPGQESNQYGRWEHRDGQSFWVFYGQYALMRDLLFNRGYRPLDTREYQEYRTARTSGQTYYGRDEANPSIPKYGSGGTITSKQYSDSRYARSGGFSGSRYTSPAQRDRERALSHPERDQTNRDLNMRRSERESGRTFGWGSRPSSPGRSFGRPSRSFGGGGRSFGRRR